MKKLITSVLIVMMTLGSAASFADGINYVSYVTIQQSASSFNQAQ